MVAPSFFLFLLMYVVSFFLVFGYGDWFIIWVGLEMNMLSFLSLSSYRFVRGSSVYLYSYFFVQSLGSGLFLVMMYWGGWVSLAMMISLGAGPFFFWFPDVLMGLGWWVGFLLMTFQKFMPLFVMSGVTGRDAEMMGLVSLGVGVVGSFGQSDLRKLMAYSSISHLGWMLLSMMMGGFVWMMYFFVYVVSLFFIVWWFYMMDANFVSDMFGGDSLLIIFLILNLSGMPPFVGFFVKWIVLWKMVVIDFFVGVYAIVCSLIMFYVYLRVCYDGLVGGGEELGWLSMKHGDFGEVFMFIVFGVITGAWILLGFL
uniref:NADH-ubiquinone oxidoreductase chain 2 n=1 Tax=Calisoga longitarsis TaxID=394809 RepID=B2CKU4_9ARAC|nr:NADH dehydrogenase subunit 2 [Calisoga longitarsis]